MKFSAKKLWNSPHKVVKNSLQNFEAFHTKLRKCLQKMSPSSCYYSHCSKLFCSLPFCKIIQLFPSHSDGNHPHEITFRTTQPAKFTNLIQFINFGIRFGNIRDEVQIWKTCDKLMWLVFINPETKSRVDLSF